VSVGVQRVQGSPETDESFFKKRGRIYPVYGWISSLPESDRIPHSVDDDDSDSDMPALVDSAVDSDDEDDPAMDGGCTARQIG
jgi:hypothetical protein